jgi:pimeloyl-ACP methyl ester carboxylesterase
MNVRVGTTAALLALAFFGLTSGFSQNASWQVAASSRVVSQELHFTNGEVHLAGTAYLPKTGDHLPAVVVLHSASAATREAALYRHLREGLPALGWALLIYDRRGSGRSSGSLENIDYETLADDGIAAQHALAKLPRIDPNRIGFWGLSQGGWLAVLAAGRSPDAAFAVSISAPLISAEDQMRFAMTNLLKIRGYSQADVQQMLQTRRLWTGYLRGSNSRAVAVEALTNAEAKPWFKLVYMPTASELTSDPEHDSYRNEMDRDPGEAVTRLKVPLLILYGDSDPWIPVAQSVERLQSLTAHQRNIEYKVIAGANHEMMFPVHETMEVNQETVRADAPQTPEYFMVLGSWLTQLGPARK